MCNATNRDLSTTFAELSHLLAAPDGWERAHLSGTGPVAALEAKLKSHYRMDYALCIASGTLGLLAVALALDLRRVDFITTPYTFGSSLSGMMLLGNRPVFADIEPDTLTLDPVAVRQAITPRTKAILAVDINGVPSDSRALRAVADEAGCWYIADAAQSFGADRDGCPASSLADAVVVSFTVGKTLFAGEGGAILTSNAEIYRKLIFYTQATQRQSRELGLQLHNEFALNCRIHPWAAIWGNTLFEHALTTLTSRQRKCFAIIDALNTLGLTEPISFEEQGIRPSFFRLSPAWSGKPMPHELVGKLRERGFPCAIRPVSISLVHRQAAFRAQFRRRFRLPYGCEIAQRQVRRRFEIEPDPYSDDQLSRELDVCLPASSHNT